MFPIPIKSILCLCLCTVLQVKAGIAILNGLTHNYTVPLGQTQRGIIQIQNKGDVSQDIKIFTKNFSHRLASSSSFDESPHSRSNLRWISLKTNLIKLQPKEVYDLQYEITIPSDVKQSGSYSSVIMVRPTNPITPKKGKAQIHLSNVVQYAVQIITDVKTEEAKTELKYLNTEVTTRNGHKYLKVGIENTGHLYEKVLVKAEFYNAITGELKKTLKSGMLSLLPNNSKNFLIDITKLKKGKYKSVLLAECKKSESTFGVNLDLYLD